MLTEKMENAIAVNVSVFEIFRRSISFGIFGDERKKWGPWKNGKGGVDLSPTGVDTNSYRPYGYPNSAPLLQGAQHDFSDHLMGKKHHNIKIHHKHTTHRKEVGRYVRNIRWDWSFGNNNAKIICILLPIFSS